MVLMQAMSYWRRVSIFGQRGDRCELVVHARGRRVEAVHPTPKAVPRPIVAHPEQELAADEDRCSRPKDETQPVQVSVLVVEPDVGPRGLSQAHVEPLAWKCGQVDIVDELDGDGERDTPLEDLEERGRHVHDVVLADAVAEHIEHHGNERHRRRRSRAR